MSKYRTHVCRFSSLDDLKPKDWQDYEKVKRAALSSGRFSVFEATNTDIAAKQMTRLCNDPDIEIDNTEPYPWTKVSKRRTALSTTPNETEGK